MPLFFVIVERIQVLPAWRVDRKRLPERQSNAYRHKGFDRSICCRKIFETRLSPKFRVIFDRPVVGSTAVSHSLKALCSATVPGRLTSTKPSNQHSGVLRTATATWINNVEDLPLRAINSRIYLIVLPRTNSRRMLIQLVWDLPLTHQAAISSNNSS